MPQIPTYYSEITESTGRSGDVATPIDTFNPVYAGMKSAAAGIEDVGLALQKQAKEDEKLVEKNRLVDLTDSVAKEYESTIAELSKLTGKNAISWEGKKGVREKMNDFSAGINQKYLEQAAGLSPENALIFKDTLRQVGLNYINQAGTHEETAMRQFGKENLDTLKNNARTAVANGADPEEQAELVISLLPEIVTWMQGQDLSSQEAYIRSDLNMVAESHKTARIYDAAHDVVIGLYGDDFLSAEKALDNPEFRQQLGITVSQAKALKTEIAQDYRIAELQKKQDRDRQEKGIKENFYALANQGKLKEATNFMRKSAKSGLIDEEDAYAIIDKTTTDQRQKIRFDKAIADENSEKTVKSARNSLATLVNPAKMSEANAAFTLALEDPANKDLTPKQVAVKVSSLPEFTKKINKLRGVLGSLPPIPQTVADDIRKTAKTKQEAEKIARQRGYDPTRVAR